MNTALLQALQSGDQEQVMRELNRSGVAESDFVKMLSDPEMSKAIASSITAASAYITKSVGMLNAQDRTFSTLFNTALIQVGLEKIQENEATPVFVMSILMILYALVNGD